MFKNGYDFVRPLKLMAAGMMFLLVLSVSATHAALRIDITQGNIDPLYIALVPFQGNQGTPSAVGEDVARLVQENLERSGLFRGIDRKSFIQTGLKANTLPRFGDWRIINAQALVTGEAKIQPDGSLIVSFRLWDVFAQERMAGWQYSTTQDNWRDVAHLISDAIYERLSGESGYFYSRVVYVDETGPKNNRTKRLAIMDQDGHNPRLITSGKTLALTPRFSPTSQEITYLSFARGKPRVYLLNIETGQQEIVGDFPGMTFAPRFSPDGKKIIMSLERNGNSNIYTLNLGTREMKRMTSSLAIDTAPCYAPDGSRIVFESDRAGRQQLYVMDADGTNVERISYGEGRYATPVWSPRGDLIAFTKQYKGRFLIGVMRPDGTGERILTEGYHNEGPAWAPNGRVLVFFRESKGEKGGPSLWSVDVTGRNERPLRTPGFASDPAWSPLIR